MTITEYWRDIPVDAFPAGIAAGPDGNVWFAEELRTHIGRITPTGEVAHFPVGPEAPDDIAAGPDGALWFTQSGGNQIGRITVDGQYRRFTAGITVGSRPLAITAGPDGNLWFTEPGGTRVGRITTSGIVTEFPVGMTPSDSVTGIAAGPDGNVWFSEGAGGDRIGRITPDGRVQRFTVGAPVGIAGGADGYVWYTEPAADRIGRISPDGSVRQSFSGTTIGGAPRGITSGPDGNMWFAETNGSRIGRITTSGEISEFAVGISPGSEPADIVTGRDGLIWFTQPRIARVSRVALDLPAAVTTGPAGVTLTGATLRGWTNPFSDPTTIAFDWGTTTAYGQSTAPQSAGLAHTPVVVTADVSGLLPETTYHYRLRANNLVGTALGGDAVFTTAPDPDRDRDGYQRRGFKPPFDCDDRDASVHPDAKDIVRNARDEDCRGGDAPFATLRSGVGIVYSGVRGGLRVTELEVTSLLAGSRIEIRCRRATSCPARTYVRRVAKRTRNVELHRALRGTVLRARSVIEVRVTKPEHLGRVRRDRIRRGRDGKLGPAISRLCLDPRKVGQPIGSVDRKLRPRQQRRGENCG